MSYHFIYLFLIRSVTIMDGTVHTVRFFFKLGNLQVQHTEIYRPMLRRENAVPDSIFNA